MKYSKKKSLESMYPNSVLQEVLLPEHEVELDFTNNFAEQSNFLEQQEASLNTDETITFIFNNELLPSANMVCITHKGGKLEYQLSLVFSRVRWKEIKPLDLFVSDLIETCRKQGLSLELEANDEYFHYLLLTRSVLAETTVAKRVNEMSLQLIDKISELL